eukprot:13478-Chlamydomonas_euryale.AAC.1
MDGWVSCGQVVWGDQCNCLVLGMWVGGTAGGCMVGGGVGGWTMIRILRLLAFRLCCSAQLPQAGLRASNRARSTFHTRHGCRVSASAPPPLRPSAPIHSLEPRCLTCLSTPAPAPAPTPSAGIHRRRLLSDA